MRKLLLTILLGLFILRVLGQLIVVLFAPRWLPPMEAWYSGLLSYPLLLPSQIIIIGLMIWMIRRPPPVRRAPILIFACIYALAMIVRYAILRTHEIPVFFHLVLASFLFVYGVRRSHLRFPIRANSKAEVQPPHSTSKPPTAQTP